MRRSFDTNTLVQGLVTLGELLGPETRHDLVVIGGASLMLRRWIHRTTADVDVLGILGDNGIETARPLPEAVAEAAARVPRLVQGLPDGWFGDDRTGGVLEHGLPDGFIDRLEMVEFPPGLRLHLASRSDIIALKLLAATIIGAGDRGSKHVADLIALEPTAAEVVRASGWVRGGIAAGDPQLDDLEHIVTAVSRR